MVRCLRLKLQEELVILGVGTNDFLFLGSITALTSLYSNHFISIDWPTESHNYAKWYLFL